MAWPLRGRECVRRWGRGGPHPGPLALTSVPPGRCRDAQEPDGRKEESGADVSAHSRKRKANVAVVSTKETGGGARGPPSYLGTRWGSAQGASS